MKKLPFPVLLFGWLLFLLPNPTGWAQNSTTNPVDKAQEIIETHAMSLIGAPLHDANFRHFAYVNPDAPKGGRARLATIGGFDSLHPFTIAGDPAAGLALIYDQLMVASLSESSSEYGLLAYQVRYPKDYSWVEFLLRPEARWHDGRPITAQDVVWSFTTLVKSGPPIYQLYYADVKTARAIGKHKVRFDFSKKNNRELPQIMGQLYILPEHWWRGRDFTKPLLEIPLGSGPYQIAEAVPNRRIVYNRVKDYWGRDLPVNQGAWNFDTLSWEYFRDQTIAHEAFKTREFDFKAESSAKLWQTGYNFPAIRQGKVVKKLIDDRSSQPMQGFLFNLRRPIFADRRVREAISYGFDFETANRQIFYNQYQRTTSYFQNTELAATGLPDQDELAVLEPFRGQIPPEIFTRIYQPPITEKGQFRKNLRIALSLLRQAGWELRKGVLTHRQTNQPFTFEILTNDARMEAVVLPFVKNLSLLGIEAKFRFVDDAQFVERVQNFDFDMTIGGIRQSESPGNEQREYWGSQAASQPGSRNQMGIQNPVIDELIEMLIFAPDRKTLVTICRALDRVLLWNFYLIPMWHLDKHRIAHWDVFSAPQTAPAQAIGFLQSWWYDAKKAKSKGLEGL